MTRVADRTILFADLRGSTALFEHMGNGRATAVVTQAISRVAERVAEHGGALVKTLGDGLMAVFDEAQHALRCACRMQDTLNSGAAGAWVVPRDSAIGGSLPFPRSVRLQIGLASGEVVEIAGDCFGDAVNVAARLLDHASDGEILITHRVFEALPVPDRIGFRQFDSIALRGRVEPVSVHVLGGRRAQDSAATAFAEAPPMLEPDAIRLFFSQHEAVLEAPQMPAVIGRSPQAAFMVDDVRVSRQHARLDWHGGSFQLTDLSSNGTYVRFADGEVVSLRRGSCTLHGRGRIGLGGSPAEPGSAVLRFDVIRLGDTL